MRNITLDIKAIELLRQIPDLIPARWDNYETDNIRVVDRAKHLCRNYLSPNRRGFYKIVFLNEGLGIFTIGVKTYHIEAPTMLFINPNEIISWRNLAGNSKSTGHFCLFKEKFTELHPAVKVMIDKCGFFSNTNNSVIKLPDNVITTVNDLFLKMHAEQQSDNPLSDYAQQAYMQLIMMECYKAAGYFKPDAITDEYNHVYNFFKLLEKETASVNYEFPIRIKAAGEFASDLSLHPNYLNALLKKHTGQNLSVHIKNRLLEESKILLLQTDWTLQNIGYAIGFAEQPNFSQFFKKNTGITPAQFRKNYVS